MRRLFIVLTSFLLTISSCTEKVNAPKPFTPKKPIPEVIIVTEPVEPVDQFKYPKSKLFLEFYSGMSKSEFHEHAKRLVDKGSLIEGSINGVVNTESSVTEYQYKIGEDKFTNSSGVSSYQPIRAIMEAGFSAFNQSYRLVPKLKKSFFRGNEWIVTDRKEGSKIGVYNRNYDPKHNLNIKVTPLEWGDANTKTVDMPKLLVDRSKKLDLLDEEVYYNKIDWEEYIRGTSKLPEAEQLVEIDSSNSVLYYRKYWTSERREEFSVEKNWASKSIYEQLNFNLEYMQEIETQSKQVITYTDYQRKTEVTYTTKQYYDEKIKKPIPVPPKPKPKTPRDIKDEI